MGKRILLSVLVIALGALALHSTYLFAQMGVPVSQDSFRTFTDEEVVQLVNRLNSEAPNALNPNHTCPDDDDFAARGCNFREMCELVEPNQGSRILYESPNGGQILNTQVNERLDTIEACINSRRNKSESASATQTELILLNSVNEAGKSEEVNRVRQYLLQGILDAGLESEFEVYTSREEVFRALADAERSLGVTLGEDLKTRYVDYVESITRFSARRSLDEEIAYHESKKFSDLVNDPLYSPTDIDLLTASEETLTRLRRGQSRTEEVLRRVKSHMRSLIESKAAQDSGNSEVYEGMIRKIDSIRLVEMESLEFEECGIPNGAYYRSTNTIEICPQYFEAPEHTLMQLVAHEVGHAIDFCGLANTGVVGADGRKRKVPIDSHPFESVGRCFEGADSIGLISFDTDDRIKWVDRQIRDLTVRGFDRENSQQLRNLYSDKVLLERGEEFRCSNTVSSEEQFDQSFADWVAAEVIAKEIEGMGVTQARRALLDASAHDLRHCRPSDENSVGEWVHEKLDELGCNLSENPDVFDSNSYYYGRRKYFDSLGGYWGKTHPLSTQRIDRILLANPTIQSAMNCSSEVRYCE